MSERTLILLRHGQTDYNFSGRMQGHLNPELNAEGQSQAARAAGVLVHRAPQRIIASDLIRARQTAQALANIRGIDLELDARLRETDLGKWEGRTADEVEESYPGAIAQWRVDPGFSPPGGETRVEVGNRALVLIQELVDTDTGWSENSAQPVVVVAHAGVIAGLTAALLDLPHSEWMKVRGMDNGAWHELRLTEEAPDTATRGHWTLVSSNKLPDQPAHSRAVDDA